MNEINIKLPVEMPDCPHRVRIIDMTSGDEFPIIGVVSKKIVEASEEYQTYEIYQWSTTGTCKDGNPNHRLQNKPGYELLSVWVNVYSDGSTGYGYQSESLAEKYAGVDNHFPVITRQQVHLVLPDPTNPGRA